MSYSFNKSIHAHTLDGKPLMGVTTVLGIINKPALIQWSANMACDYIGANFHPDKHSEPEALEALLNEAKYAHKVKKEKAGDWGTIVHKAIEEWIKPGSVDGVSSQFQLDESQAKAFNHFVNWAQENKVEFLESEKHVYSREHWIGGIVDLVFMMDGKKYIGDIKTSSGIYDEAFFQMGAYNLCLEDMGEHQDIEGYIVINLRKDGKMDLKRADNMEINKQAFKHALGLYQIKQSIK